MDDKELEKFLLETYRISKENNEMLKKMNKRNTWARNWTIARWVIVIIVLGIAFYYAFPYLNIARKEISLMSSNFSSLVQGTQAGN